MAMTIVENRSWITGGVDTHLHFHVAAAVDANGGLLGTETFPVADVTTAICSVGSRGSGRSTR